MMKSTLERFVWVLVAGVAGCLGESMYKALFDVPVQASSYQVIRASRFELVNPTGRVTAVLESDPEGSARLRFLGEGDGNNALVIKRSAIRFWGSDGKPRIQMRLGAGDTPALEMGDATSEQRLSLGVVQADYFPSATPDAWALLLGNPVSRNVVASMGMVSDTQKVATGSLWVRSNNGKRWAAIPEEKPDRRPGPK